MTSTRSIDCDLSATRDKWRQAINEDNRTAESLCLARLDNLLDERLAAKRRPKPSAT
jgi:hypothetical protein